jgi:hypothetical protein
MGPSSRLDILYLFKSLAKQVLQGRLLILKETSVDHRGPVRVGLGEAVGLAQCLLLNDFTAVLVLPIQ